MLQSIAPSDINYGDKNKSQAEGNIFRSTRSAHHHPSSPKWLHECPCAINPNPASTGDYNPREYGATANAGIGWDEAVFISAADDNRRTETILRHGKNGQGR